MIVLPQRAHSTPQYPPSDLVQLFLLDQGFTHPLTGFHSRGSQVKAADYLVGEKPGWSPAGGGPGSLPLGYIT